MPDSSHGDQKNKSKVQMTPTSVPQRGANMQRKKQVDPCAGRNIAMQKVSPPLQSLTDNWPETILNPKSLLSGPDLLLSCTLCNHLYQCKVSVNRFYTHFVLTFALV